MQDYIINKYIKRPTLIISESLKPVSGANEVRICKLYALQFLHFKHRKILLHSPLSYPFIRFAMTCPVVPPLVLHVFITTIVEGMFMLVSFPFYPIKNAAAHKSAACVYTSTLPTDISLCNYLQSKYTKTWIFCRPIYLEFSK